MRLDRISRRWRHEKKVSNVLFVFSFVFVAGVSAEFRKWRFDRQPRVSHEKISLERHLDPSGEEEVRELIVDIHNYYRMRVEPSAANMLEMSWDESAAKDASRWSKECLVLQHDNATGRWVDNFGSCGQNIFIATKMVPWLFAIETWWLEKNLFTFGSHDPATNDLHDVGHYTQLVWAATHKVGCGVNKCYMTVADGSRKMYYLYVCNYCPIGNFPERLGTPYERGEPCSGCRGHCNRRTAKRKKRLQRRRRKKKKLRRKETRGRRTRTRTRARRPAAARSLNRPKRKIGSDRGRRRRQGFNHLQRERLKGRMRHRRRKKGGPRAKVTSSSAAPSSSIGLCTNSCPVADLWINCGELHSQWSDWLCDRGSSDGFRNCRATCTCPGKIRN